MADHGLRTTGRPTGNFGKPKVQGKASGPVFSKATLSKESLKIPTRSEAFARLQIAYDLSTDPKIRQTLGDMLRKHKATLGS